MENLSLLILIFSTLVSYIACDGICNSKLKGAAIIADPDDCSSFYICNGAQHFKFACGSKIGPKKVFDPLTKTCVTQGSSYDHSACKYKRLEQRCMPGLSRTYEHPDNCAKYYHCRGGMKPVKMECPYPRLYSRKTHKCELYLFVKCGMRKEPKDPCDYKVNQCKDSGCVPCRTRFPTCVAHPDGANPWQHKLWTPFFVICKDERVLIHGDCRQSGKAKLFNPKTRTCISIMDLLRKAVSKRMHKRRISHRRGKR